MPLDKQCQIYNVDTGNFYSNTEAYLHRRNHKVRQERNKMKPLIQEKKSNLLEYGFTSKEISKFVREGITDVDSEEIINAIDEYAKLYKIYKHKTAIAKDTKQRLLDRMKNKVEANTKSNGKHHIRKLRFIDYNFRECDPQPDNIISVFDSSLTRTIGAEPDKLSDEFMVLQVYYFDICKDLIYNGFEFNGNKYIYFTSSAGQIRTKKCVFIKESTWNKYQKTLMCGLTIDRINELGGMNSN